MSQIVSSFLLYLVFCRCSFRRYIRVNSYNPFVICQLSFSLNANEKNA